MKKNLFLLLLLPALTAIAVPAGFILHSDNYKVDTSASKVAWFAEKVTGKHNGTINIKSGNVANTHGHIGGMFVMDMTSIAVTDLTGGSKGKLEGHLKSDDFFSVDKHPTSTFEITSVSPATGVAPGEPNFIVAGKMTIKGITNDITFPALIKFEGNQMTTKADIKIDRTKYDIRYGSKTFFPDIADKGISDEFVLKVDIVATM